MTRDVIPIKIVVVGTGGFGREVLETLRDCNKEYEKYKILGFLDDNKSFRNKKINRTKILGGTEWFSKKTVRNVNCVIAIADSKIRKKIAQKLKKKKVKFATVIHPSVIYPKSSKIGKGTIIQAGVILTSNVKIRNHVHINMDCTIAHDSTLENFVTIAPGVHVNGNTKVKTDAFVGSGTVMKEGITIGRSAIIGAGTVLIDDVSDHSLYVGVPGKLKKKI